MVGSSRVVAAGRGKHAASLERASNQGGKAASPWSWRSIGVDRGQHDSRLSRRYTRSSRSSPSYCTCAAAPNSSDSIGSATRGGVRKSLINLFKGIGKERNRGELRGMYRTVEVIKEFGEDYRSLSNESLQAKTAEFKQRIGAGETLDSILPEAFALVREASSRVLGMRHFDVQLLGGMVLHNGDIAEMQTGEGKTLVSTLPAYLNALEGKGVHIVTVNDYLAKRDSEWMGQLHQFLGLTVDVVQSSSTPSQRKQAYSADITYVTNQELGFDYLRDNMEFEEENVVLQRDLNFAIIDEVDSILIDEGRNPLLISMLAEEEDQDDFYTKASHIAGELREDLHFTSNLKERTVELTEEGMLEVEYLLGVENMWEGGSSWAKYIVDAIKARQHYIRDVNYIVKDDQVQIIDEFTGRVKPLSRWSGGIHQAVEAKENLKVQSENETAASVTYQCFFKMYNKRAGMTGTAATESEEFWETYGLRVVPIPTNRDCIREDSRSLIYFTQEEKWEGVISEIAEIHSTGQPVLVGTTSVDHSELISRLLSRVGIEHSLLNAKPTNAAQEGKIISQAGRLGAVTISTNMAGRGTDILLGGNPTELVKSVLLENLGPALMKQDDPDAFSGLSEILNMDFPPEYMGLVARAKSSALLECTIPMTAYEVDQLVRGLCSFARQMLEGGGNNILADSQFETYLESKDYAALESFLGSKDFSIGEELPNSAFPPIKKFANAAIFLLEYCNSICRREGDLVRSLGGLHVVGTQLHDSRRVDNQLRGRAGRQGDPGSTIFILSLEDDLLKVYGQDHVGKLMRSILDDNTELSISSGLVDSQLLSLQREVEDWFTGARKQVYKYDQFLDIQRKQIYRLRRHILTSSEHELMHLIFTYIRADVGEIVQKHAARHPKHWDLYEVCNEVEDLVNEDLFPDSFAKDLEKNLAEGSWVLAKEHNYPTSSSYLFAYKAAGQNSGFAIDQISEKRKASEERWSPELSFVVNEITEYVLSEYFCKLRACAALRRGMSTIMSEQRSRMLRLIDERWKKHLKHMETLRNSVSLRVFGQLDPLEEYKVDSARALMVLINSIQREIVREIFQDLNDQM